MFFEFLESNQLHVHWTIKIHNLTLTIQFFESHCSRIFSKNLKPVLPFVVCVTFFLVSRVILGLDWILIKLNSNIGLILKYF